MWDNNEVQFARLLCELVANNEKLSLMDVAESMDLGVGSVHEILDRAHEVWEKAKEMEWKKWETAKRETLDEQD